MSRDTAKKDTPRKPKLTPEQLCAKKEQRLREVYDVIEICNILNITESALFRAGRDLPKLWKQSPFFERKPEGKLAQKPAYAVRSVKELVKTAQSAQRDTAILKLYKIVTSECGEKSHAARLFIRTAREAWRNKWA